MPLVTISDVQPEMVLMDGKTYLRFGAGDWYKSIGSDFVPVGDDEELEAAYQANV